MKWRAVIRGGTLIAASALIASLGSGMIVLSATLNGAGSSGPQIVVGGGGYLGSSIPEGTYIYANEHLLSPSGDFQLIMQGDGNLVLYDLSTGVARWATGTEGNSGNFAVFQTDGNLVVYSSSGQALWSSHTYPYSGMTLNMQDDGNLVIYQGSSPLWASDTANNEMNCWPSNSCSPGEFIYAFLQIPPTAPLTGVNAPTITSNTFAMAKWEAAEGSQIQSNPLDVTQVEPGSYNYNTSNVQVYMNSGGQSADYWGIDATDATFYGSVGNYGPILNVLRNPVNNEYQQCLDLASAVGNSQWGTGDFSAVC